MLPRRAGSEAAAAAAAAAAELALELVRRRKKPATPRFGFAFCVVIAAPSDLTPLVTAICAEAAVGLGCGDSADG
jgi:hypothetical protein